MVASVTRMEVRSEVTEVILNITLEIVRLLTGEDYTLVKKTLGECVVPSSRPSVSAEWSRSQGPFMQEPSPESLTHEKSNNGKILELANEIIELLTGEIPIRCQDVAVYFSTEEWDYIEEHKDLYQDHIMDELRPLTSPGGLHNDTSPCEQVSLASSQPNPSSCSHLRNEVKKTGKNAANESSDVENSKYICSYVPANQTQYPLTHIMEEPILGSGGRVTDANVYTPTHDIERYPSTHAMEEAVSCDVENPEIYGPTNNTQYLSSCITEEPATCDEEDLVDPEVDNTQYSSSCIMVEPLSCDEEDFIDSDIGNIQYASSHIMEEPLSCDEEDFTGHYIYTPTGNTEYPSSRIMEEPLSCDEEDFADPDIDKTQYPSSHIKEEPLSCEEDLTEPNSYAPPDQLQYSLSNSKEEPASCDEDLTEPISYTPTDPIRHNLITRIKEEPTSCDEDLTDTNSSIPTDHFQYPSPSIKEETVSCDEEDLTESNSYTTTDHLQYPSPNVKEEPLSCDEGLTEPSSSIHMVHTQHNLITHIKEEPYPCDGPRRYIPTLHTQEHQYACFKKEEDFDNREHITHPNISTLVEQAQYAFCTVKVKPLSYVGENLSHPHIYMPEYCTQKYPASHIKEEPVSSDERDFSVPTSYTHYQSTQESGSGRCHGKYPFPQLEEGPNAVKFGYPKDPNIHNSTDHTQTLPSACNKEEVSEQHSPILDVKTENSSSPKKVIVVAHLVDIDHTEPGSTNNKLDQIQSQKCVVGMSNHVRHDIKDARPATRNRPMVTPEAGQTFGDISNLTKYSRAHSKKKIPQCPECGLFFLRKRQLEFHLRRHAKQKALQSSDGGKYYSNNAQLDQKKRAEKPMYQCSVCRKRFDDEPNLVAHEKTHKGDKPFQCLECGKCFSIYYQLYVHKKTHTEDAQYA